MSQRSLLAPQPTLGRAYFANVTTVQTEIMPDNTNYVGIFALSNAVYVKFGGDDPTSSNFDDIVEANKKEYLQLPSNTRIVKIVPISATPTDIWVLEK